MSKFPFNRKKAAKLFVSLAVGWIALSVALGLCATLLVTTGRLASVINTNTKDVQVHYSAASGNAWSGFRFLDLEVKGEDSNVIWQINIGQADLNPSLWRLARRIFHATRLHAEGFSFKLKFKEKKPGQNGGPSSYRDNWRIWLEDIQLKSIKNVEIGAFSYKSDGKASLTSNFYFWPEYELEIVPSELVVQEKNLDIDFKFELDRVRFKESPGFKFFRGLSGDLSFKGYAPSLSFLNYYFRSAKWLAIDGQGARLNASIKLDRGIVLNRSTADFASSAIALKAGVFSAKGAGAIKLRAPQLSVQFSDYDISPPGIHGDDLLFTATSKQIDLAAPLSDLDLEFRLKETRIHDLGRLNSYLPKSKIVQLKKGEASFSAAVNVSTSTNKASGPIELKFRKLHARVADNLIETDLNIKFDLEHLAPKEKLVKASKVSCKFSKLSLSNDSRQGYPQVSNWWGEVAALNASLEVEGKAAAKGTAQFSGRDGKPLLLALRNAGILPIDLTTLTSMREVTSQAQVTLGTESLRVKDFELKSTTLESRGDFEMHDGKTSGRVRIKHPLRTFEVDLK